MWVATDIGTDVERRTDIGNVATALGAWSLTSVTDVDRAGTDVGTHVAVGSRHQGCYTNIGNRCHFGRYRCRYRCRSRLVGGTSVTDVDRCWQCGAAGAHTTSVTDVVWVGTDVGTDAPPRPTSVTDVDRYWSPPSPCGRLRRRALCPPPPPVVVVVVVLFVSPP